MIWRRPRVTRREPLFVKRFRDLPYGVELVLLVGPIAQADAWIKRTIHADEGVGPGEPSIMGRHAVFLPQCSCGGCLPTSVVWLPRFKMRTGSVTYLAHEVLHHVQYALTRIGHRPTDADEASAYYFSWLFERCLSALGARFARRRAR